LVYIRVPSPDDWMSYKDGKGEKIKLTKEYIGETVTPVSCISLSHHKI
jgi:hypothetical protein